MRYQHYLLPGLVVAAIIAGLVFFAISRLTPSVTQPTQPQAGDALDLQPVDNTVSVSDIVVPSPSLAPLPTADRITSSGVSISNFYKLTSERNSRGDTTIVKNDNYSVNYMASSDSFLISITASPFETHRQTAEQALLTLLGIPASEACKLKVTITTPRFANPDLVGQRFPLSFCK